MVLFIEFQENAGTSGGGGGACGGVLRHVVLTRGSQPRSQSSGTGPSASCGYYYPLSSKRGQYSGKIRFIEP